MIVLFGQGKLLEYVAVQEFGTINIELTRPLILDPARTYEICLHSCALTQGNVIQGVRCFTNVNDTYSHTAVPLGALESWKGGDVFLECPVLGTVSTPAWHTLAPVARLERLRVTLSGPTHQLDSWGLYAWAPDVILLLREKGRL